MEGRHEIAARNYIRYTGDLEDLKTQESRIKDAISKIKKKRDQHAHVLAELKMATEPRAVIVQDTVLLIGTAGNISVVDGFVVGGDDNGS